VLRFVVLEHVWNGVHWDVMLESEEGGPLRTWAVDAPIVPGRELPARALADHRAAYLEYEGEVSGGRGEVNRVDRGGYERLAWADDLVRVRLAGVQFTGVLELRKAVVGTDDSGMGAGGESSGGWTLRLGNLD
jgi:hypothetical protein